MNEMAEHLGRVFAYIAIVVVAIYLALRRKKTPRNEEETMSDLKNEKVGIRQNGMGRYIIVKADDRQKAWSGARWTPIDTYGFPTGPFQVLNFDTSESAMEYAPSYGFIVV